MREDLSNRFGNGYWTENGILYFTPPGNSYDEDARVRDKEQCEKVGWPWTQTQSDAYDKYLQNVITAYRRHRRNMSLDQVQEEAFERRAAFGLGVKVVNVITGEEHIT